MLKTLYNEANDLFQSVGFTLRSWTTNNQLIQTSAERDERQAPVSTNTNVLGLLWNQNEDTMHCKALPALHQSTVTPKLVLRETARLSPVQTVKFFPVGFYPSGSLAKRRRLYAPTRFFSSIGLPSAGWL